MTDRNTYLSRTDPDEDLGGRFKRQHPSTIIGKHLTGQYPQQLPTSHWSGDPTGTEPALGIDVNELPDLGFVESGNLGTETPIANNSPLTIVERSVPIFSKLLRRRV